MKRAVQQLQNETIDSPGLCDTRRTDQGPSGQTEGTGSLNRPLAGSRPGPARYACNAIPGRPWLTGKLGRRARPGAT